MTGRERLLWLVAGLALGCGGDPGPGREAPRPQPTQEGTAVEPEAPAAGRGTVNRLAVGERDGADARAVEAARARARREAARGLGATAVQPGAGELAASPFDRSLRACEAAIADWRLHRTTPETPVEPFSGGVALVPDGRWRDRIALLQQDGEAPTAGEARRLFLRREVVDTGVAAELVAAGRRCGRGACVSFVVRTDEIGGIQRIDHPDAATARCLLAPLRGRTVPATGRDGLQVFVDPGDAAAPAP